MPAHAGPLETYANNSSPLAPSETSGRDQKRRDRWEIRSLLWDASSLKRVRHCGRVTRSNADLVTLRSREGVAGYAGLQSCGSVWSDPVCASKILSHRALEIGGVLEGAITAGHALGFGTLTGRHRKGQPLELLWKASSRAWARATSGKRWVKVQERHGVEGWVRVWEVTDGRNGWHVHVHFVVVLPGDATAEDMDAIGRSMFDQWSSSLVSSGLGAPLLKGQEWHIVSGDDASAELGSYMFKLVEQGDDDRARALGLELAYTQPGRAKSEYATRPVWSILRALEETGEKVHLDRWHEWERASKGKRQVGWSKGLRDRFAPSLDELTDDQVVEAEMGSADDDLVAFTPKAYAQIVRVPGLAVHLLEAAEFGGVPAVREVLDLHEIPYSLCGARGGV